MTVLRTERLVLRPPVMADAAALHAIFSDPASMRYWSTLPHTEMAETEAFLRSMIEGDPATSAEFIVEHEGEVIGRIAFWRIPDLGYHIRRQDWGRGFGTEALAAVVAYGFEERGLHEITADIDPRNVASMRMLEKNGFQEVGREAATIKVGDEWCDSVYFRLMAEDWRAGR